MVDLLKKLLSKWACHHKWTVHKHITVRNERREPIEFVDVLICDNCGKIKKVEY